MPFNVDRTCQINRPFTNHDHPRGRAGPPPGAASGKHGSTSRYREFVLDAARSGWCVVAAGTSSGSSLKAEVGAKAGQAHALVEVCVGEVCGRLAEGQRGEC